MNDDPTCCAKHDRLLPCMYCVVLAPKEPQVRRTAVNRRAKYEDEDDPLICGPEDGRNRNDGISDLIELGLVHDPHERIGPRRGRGSKVSEAEIRDLL